MQRSVQRLHVPKEQVLGREPELRPRPAGRSDLPGTAGDLSFTGTRAELGHVGLGGPASGTSLHSVLGFPLGGPRVTVCVSLGHVCSIQDHVCARGTLEGGRKEAGHGAAGGSR